VLFSWVCLTVLHYYIFVKSIYSVINFRIKYFLLNKIQKYLLGKSKNTNFLKIITNGMIFVGQKHNEQAQILTGKNALQSDINQPWEQDNQAWWDWYVTLAENPDNYRAEQIIVPESPSIKLPTDDEILEELKEPFSLNKKDLEQFRLDGYVKLKNIFSTGAVIRLRHEILTLLVDFYNTKLDGGERNRFLSLEMVWLNNTFIRSFVLSKRIAQICGELLDVSSIRLYHDNILSKEPGCGRTPWHYDDHHFPLATDDVVTAWIPAQPIPLEMGPLSFAKPLKVFELVQNIPFNKFDTSYDRKISQIFAENQVLIDESAFDVGEVSFHHNKSFHTAGVNNTNQSRIVLATTYYADGARVLKEPTMVSGDWQKFIPDVNPGDLAASEYNPICWQSEA